MLFLSFFPALKMNSYINYTIFIILSNKAKKIQFMCSRLTYQFKLALCWGIDMFFDEFILKGAGGCEISNNVHEAREMCYERIPSYGRIVQKIFLLTFNVKIGNGRFSASSYK